MAAHGIQHFNHFQWSLIEVNEKEAVIPYVALTIAKVAQILIIAIPYLVAYAVIAAMNGGISLYNSIYHYPAARLDPPFREPATAKQPFDSEAVRHARASDFSQNVDLERAEELYKTGNIIGQAAWARIGDVGPIPKLSAEVANRLETPCPFWPKRRLIDTHLLIWIPKSITKAVNGHTETTPVTLRNLPNLIPGTGYTYISEAVMTQHGDTPVRQSRWLLVPKELIPGSSDQSFAKLPDFVAAHGREMPHAVEVAVALFMKQFLSPGTYLLGLSSHGLHSFTRCIETVQVPREEQRSPLVVGAFSASGLDVDRYYPSFCGVVGPEEVQALVFSS